MDPFAIQGLVPIREAEARRVNGGSLHMQAPGNVFAAPRPTRSKITWQPPQTITFTASTGAH